MDADVKEVSRPSGLRLAVIVPFGLAILSLVGVVASQWTAKESDFAFANLLTAMLSTLAWILIVVGCLFSNLDRTIWKAILFLPLACAAVFLGFNRFVRLDGELIPQWESRWGGKPASPPAVVESADSKESLFVSTENDFPQFLGPSRDGVERSLQVDSDWLRSPPEILWQQPIGKGWAGFVVQGDVAFTMEQWDATEWVAAYSMLDGSLIWKYEISALHTNVAGGTGPRATPTIWNSRIYACSAVSQVVCLDIYTGNLIWSKDLLELDGSTQAEFEKKVSWGRSGSPLIVNDLVVVPFGGASENMQPLIAFDGATGEERWRAGSGEISYSSPMLATVDGVEQVLFVSENKLAAYTPESGEELWSFPWPGASNANPAVSQPIVLDGDRIFLSKGYGEGARMLSVQQEGGEWQIDTLWNSAQVLRTKFTNCVVQNGFAYGLSDGILECVDLSNGKRQWKKGRYRQGQLMLVGEQLLISSEAGEIVLVNANPEQYQELAKMDVIGDVTWNPIALSGDRVLIRNSDEAACLRLPVLRVQDSTGAPATQESL